MERTLSFIEKSTLVSFIILLVILTGGKALFAQSGNYRYIETNNLVTLVDEAASLIRQNGEAAFGELAIKDSKWRSGDTYIFVLDPTGTFYVHEDPGMVGKNYLDLKDKNGKPIVKWLIQKAKGEKHSGWIHYLWVKPGQTVPTWKTTFVKMARTKYGKEYIVGCGLYDMKMEKAFAVDAVDDAINLMKTDIGKAFQILRDKTSEFVYKDSYVFVMDTTFTLLVDPPFPKLEGTNVYHYKDIYGKYIFREFMKVAREKGSGWVDYMWPRPGETSQSKKSSYVKKAVINKKLYLVGTGIYLD
ncbi:MAG: cache domain-containing protein [bacterium]